MGIVTDKLIELTVGLSLLPAGDGGAKPDEDDLRLLEGGVNAGNKGLKVVEDLQRRLAGVDVIAAGA